jgi:CubicO group peptidase (beta-lactamase class C family)
VRTDQREALAGVIEAARQRRKVPGAAFGILHDGDVYAAGFGVTSVENPLLVNADTLFQIGSVSKTFTGTVAMMLVEQGKLDLDAPIITYLPDLKLPGEETTAKVTLKHLFTHTGGWEGDFFDDYGSGDDALARYVAEMHDLPQLAPIGTLWSYNNAGFNLAGRVIEVVAGKPFEAVVKELVFDRLGMTRSSFFPAEVMLQRFAVGHNAGDNPTVATPWPIPRCSSAAGAISSSINDMMKYARFHLSGGVTESGERLLTEETIKLMQSELFPTGNWAHAVGVTWYMRDVQNVRLVGHGGSTNGFQASFQLAPAQGFAFIGLTNVSNGSALNTEILNWTLENILGVKDPERALLTLPDEQLSQFVGTYQATLTQADVSLKDGQLWLQVKRRGGFPTRNSPPPTDPPPAPVRLSFFDQDRGVALDPPFEDMQVEFLRGADGKLVWLRTGGRVHRPVAT